ncbi:MAG: TetR/AcrR family transcriptional regulator [Acidimicrobiales bacterium]
MTASQLERRRRVLAAVIELVSKGGLDAAGMKEIAERSGVALGTIYRYFSSRDHVVAAALVEWARGLEPRLARRPAAESPTPAARISVILHEAMRAYQRDPSFARALILAAHSTDPFAGECYEELGRLVNGILGAALEPLEPAERERVLQVLGAVWYHAIVQWVNGRMTIGQVFTLLDNAVDLLLRGTRVTV